MKTPLLQFIIASTAINLMIACQKELSNTPANPNTPATPSVPTVNDSALSDTRDIYLWYDQIPASYDGKKFKSLDSFMIDIRQFSKETGFPNPVDRFSFAIKKAEWDNASSGAAHDFGISVFFLAGTAQLYVKYVEKSSPAGQAGIKRGWQVKALNNNSNIDTSSASIDMIVNAVFNSSSTTFTFLKPDGTTVNIPLNATPYQEHPVMADTVLALSTGNIGYMVFNSFLGDSLDIANNFKRVFTAFDQKNVSDVVIDLRYNGGGYVFVAEMLSNYLAPLAANNQTMFTEQFNNKYSNYNETFKFSKKNNLNLSRIFFIVSKNTASASELVINNLKPFMNVKLVGPSQTTYGKPVGFFNIPEGDWYIFPISFRSINSAGNSNYYNGFTIDKTVNDGVNKDWGDVNESCLASALKYIQTGSFRLSGAPEIFISTNSNDRLQKKQVWNIAVENRKKRM